MTCHFIRCSNCRSLTSMHDTVKNESVLLLGGQQLESHFFSENLKARKIIVPALKQCVT